MLLPILDSVQHLQAIALARSLVHHNTGTQMNLVLASDLAGLRRLLGPLDEAMRASKADGVRVHVLAVERLPDVASAVWLAIDLLTHARGLIALEPGALVLGDLGPLWQQLSGPAPGGAP